MYVGSLRRGGGEAQGAFRKEIEELPHLPDSCPNEYVAARMVYPADLLAKNISGYALL